MTKQDFDLPDAATLAYQMSEAVADSETIADPTAYLVDFVTELFELEPGVRQHFSDALLTELKEEIRRDQGTLSGFPVACIETVERRWEEQS